MTHILLIGSGFLGLYVARALLPADNEVTIIDKKEPSSVLNHPLLEQHRNSPKLKYKWKSAGDTMDMAKEIKDYDAIVYTAAIADVPYAMQNPLDTVEVNVKNTTAFMEMLRLNDYQGRFIGMSSESIYGHHPDEELPLKEDKTIPKPGNVYGATKLAQENMISTYGRCYGLKTVILRSATMFGPYSRLKQAMPIFIGQMLKDEDVTLEGTGEQSRDFCYVINTVDAIGLAIETPGIEGEIFNIGSGEEMIFSRLLGAMQTLLQSKSKIVNKPWRPGEKGLRVALDISKAKEKLKYVVTMPTIAGIKDTAMWYASDILHWDLSQMDKLLLGFGIPEIQRRAFLQSKGYDVGSASGEKPGIEIGVPNVESAEHVFLNTDDIGPPVGQPVVEP